MLYSNEIFPGTGDYQYETPTKLYFNLELYILNAVDAYHGASLKDIIDYVEHFNFNQVPVIENQVKEILGRFYKENVLYKKSNLWFRS